MDLKNWLAKTITYWTDLEKKQQFKFLAIAVVSLACLAVLLTVVFRQEYVPVFTSLSAEDAGQISEEMDALGITYELADGGATVKVPAEDADRARIGAAQANLPRGGSVGYEALESLPIGTTDAELKVHLQRALQGELQRTLISLPSIDTARVHLSLPEQSIWASDQTETAEASVVVSLRVGERLDSGQVEGIVHLVSKAVKDLPPEKVVVMDQSFNILNNNSGSFQTGHQVQEQFEVAQSFAEQMERSVIKMLVPIFGYNNVKVTVNAQLDFDELRKDKHLFLPVDEELGQGIVSRIVQTEQYFEGSSTGGAPGVDPNDPNSNSYVGGEGQQTIEEINEKSIEYEINEIVESLVVAPGKVQSLSVAVVVNQEDLSSEQRTALQDLISASVGSDDGRQDQVVISAMPFTTADIVATPDDPGGESGAGGLQDMLTSPWALAGLALLLVILAYVALRRKSEDQQTRSSLAGQAQNIPRDEVETAQDQVASSEEIRKQSEQQEMTERLKKLVRHNPEEFAQLIRAWMAEDRR